VSAYGRDGVSAYGNFEDNAFLSENYEPTLTTDNYSATGTDTGNSSGRYSKCMVS
jgi:hypothetical protein